ncbi:hypothetical protein GCM10027051_01140 [Niabella terrae]
MLHFLTIFFFCFLTITASAQKPAQFIQEGNEFYKKGQLAQAINSYEKVTEGPQQYIALMNKGNALYRLRKYEEAIKVFRQVSGAAGADKKIRSGAYYNTGVVYSNQKKITESIEAYKEALRLNWQDNQARENLQKALSELPKKGGGGGGGQEKPQESRSRLNQKQAQQQLDRLEQKERETQQRVAGKKTEYGGSEGKDW